MPYYLPTKRIVDPRVVRSIREHIKRGFFEAAPHGDRHESVSEILANIRYHGGIDDRAIPIEPGGASLWQQDYETFARFCNFDFCFYTVGETLKSANVRNIIPVAVDEFDQKLVEVYNQWFDEIGEGVYCDKLEEETLKVVDEKYPNIASKVRQAYVISKKDCLSDDDYRELRQLGQDILSQVNRSFFLEEKRRVEREKKGLLKGEVRRIISEGVYVPREDRLIDTEKLNLAQAIRIAHSDLAMYDTLVCLHSGLLYFE
jgi:hypothetical protein